MSILSSDTIQLRVTRCCSGLCCQNLRLISSNSRWQLQWQLPKMTNGTNEEILVKITRVYKGGNGRRKTSYNPTNTALTIKELITIFSNVVPIQKDEDQDRVTETMKEDLKADLHSASTNFNLAVISSINMVNPSRCPPNLLEHV